MSGIGEQSFTASRIHGFNCTHGRGRLLLIEVGRVTNIKGGLAMVRLSQVCLVAILHPSSPALGPPSTTR